MEILLWLVPPGVVTVVAMAWVTWLGREGRGEVDRDVAVRRLGEAMQKDLPTSHAPRSPSLDHSTGIAVRPSRARRPPASPASPASAEERQRLVS